MTYAQQLTNQSVPFFPAHKYMGGMNMNPYGELLFNVRKIRPSNILRILLTQRDFRESLRKL